MPCGRAVQVCFKKEDEDDEIVCLSHVLIEHEAEPNMALHLKHVSLKQAQQEHAD